MDHLRQLGYKPDAVLGSGMEGTVVDLGGDLIAKLWHRRKANELETLKTFYEAVAGAGATVSTPRIHRVIDLEGHCATVENRLSGRPLWTATNSGSPTLADEEIACVTDVLAALAAIEVSGEMGVLPILEGEAAFQTQAVSFERSLAALVERRVEGSRGPLSARLPELEVVAAAVIDRLIGLEPNKVCLVHGDLIPANILVDQDSRPLGVLDFGFLTTLGDPAFDGAIAASIYDMYGPRAAETEAVLDEAIAARFGYAATRLNLYRAAYALTTSNCFSSAGTDGHFEWCLRVLERPQVREVLEL